MGKHLLFASLFLGVGIALSACSDDKGPDGGKCDCKVVQDLAANDAAQLSAQATTTGVETPTACVVAPDDNGEPVSFMHIVSSDDNAVKIETNIYRGGNCSGRPVSTAVTTR